MGVGGIDDGCSARGENDVLRNLSSFGRCAWSFGRGDGGGIDNEARK